MNCPVSTVFFSLPFPEYKENVTTGGLLGKLGESIRLYHGMPLGQMPD